MGSIIKVGEFKGEDIAYTPLYGSDPVITMDLTMMFKGVARVALKPFAHMRINSGSEDFNMVKGYFNNRMEPKELYLYLRK